MFEISLNGIKLKETKIMSRIRVQDAFNPKSSINLTRRQACEKRKSFQGSTSGVLSHK